MKDKMISTRISEELENLVIKYANEHKWSKSFALSEILYKFFYELSGDSA
jgi:hypothetical protein